jgi:ParB-like chromosome segregation protein Spo0J
MTTGEMQLVQLEPNTIEWPTTRVTSYYLEGEKELLAGSLKAMGQQQPVVVIEVEGRYIGVDGMNRCMDAIHRKLPSIPCVVKVGTDVDVMVSNLVLNSLHGRTKASEQAMVVAELESLGVSRTKLGQLTGHGRQWVDQHLRVSQASPPVRQFLDDGLITLGHADELAKVHDLDTQAHLCHELLQKRWTVPQLRERIRAATQPEGHTDRRGGRRGADEVPSGSSCVYCHHEGEQARLVRVILCGDCGETIAQVRMVASPQDELPAAERAAYQGGIEQDGPETV